MREYGLVHCAFWGSPDARALTDIGKVLALYLITGPHSNGIGCYRLPDLYIRADLRWKQATVDAAFRELAGVGFAIRDGDLVLLPNFLRWNPLQNPNAGKARRKEFEALPSGPIKAAAARSLLNFGAYWPEGFQAILEGFANGSKNPSARVSDGLPDNRSDPIRSDQNLSEQINIGASRLPLEMPDGDNAGKSFDRFWAVYPKKAKKREAAKVWASKRLHAKADQLIADVKRRLAEHARWLEGFIPDPTTYLRGERWNDAIEPVKPNGAKNGAETEAKARAQIIDLAKDLKIEQGDEDWPTFKLRVERANAKRLGQIEQRRQA